MRLEIMFDWTFDCIDKYAKMFSVKYVDYDDFVDEILSSFHTDYDLYKFHLNLYNAYRWYIENKSVVVSEEYKPSQKMYKICSDHINVSPNVLAMCLPLYVRKKFFDYDRYLWRFFCKCDLVYHLYN